jgi:hypothetical protein
MTIDRAVFRVWMALVIHVVEQADRLPKVDIVPAQLREMLHRISDRIAMFPQTFGLDPFVKDIQCARSERLALHMVCGFGGCFNIERPTALDPFILEPDLESLNPEIFARGRGGASE